MTAEGIWEMFDALSTKTKAMTFKSIMPIILVILFLLMYNEAWLMASYENRLISGISLNTMEDKNLNFFGIIRYMSFPLLAMAMTALLPYFLLKSKTVESFGGEKINIVEIIIMLSMIGLIVFVTHEMYILMDSAVDALYQQKIISEVYMNFCKRRNSSIIIGQVFADLVLAGIAVHDLVKNEETEKK